MPVIFVGIGEDHWEYDPVPQYPYPNPRVPDTCPNLQWPSMAFPTKEQIAAFLTALQPLANVRAIFHMPNWTIVELEHGYDRIYGPKSLPGIVARKAALYHHAEAPFFKSLKGITSESCVYSEQAKFLQTDNVTAGSWLEVDVVSSGLVIILAYGKFSRKPERLAGHPIADFKEWQVLSIAAIFEEVKNITCEDMSGAPIKHNVSRGLGGFCRLPDGVVCFIAPLDDLVASKSPAKIIEGKGCCQVER